MSRKPTQHSLVAVVSIRENTPAEISALDSMTRRIFPVKGRGRRMKEEDAAHLGDLVTVLSAMRARAEDVPLQYLTNAHLANPDLVRALLALLASEVGGVSKVAFLTVAEEAALRNGAALPVVTRQLLSNAAAR